jgi:hypothetical protein
MLQLQLQRFEVYGTPKYTNIDSNGMIGGIESVAKIESDIGYG